MKKILLSLFCFMIVFSLTGCRLFMSTQELKIKPTPTPEKEFEEIDKFLLKYVKNIQVDENTYIVVKSNSRGYNMGVADILLDKEIIEPSYDSIDYGYDENGELKFLAKNINNYYLFDREGNLIKDIGTYKDAVITNKDISRIEVLTMDDKMKVINSKGNIIFAGNYDFLKYDEERNNYIVGKEGLYGVATTHGKIIIPLEYTAIYSGAVPTEYIAKKDGGYGIVDISNNVLVDFHYLKLATESKDEDEKKSPYYTAMRLDEKVGVITSNDEIIKEFE